MSVGDVNSAERGSGARYNSNKTRLDLIPVETLSRFWSRVAAHHARGDAYQEMLSALAALERGRYETFRAVFPSLAGYLDVAAEVFDYGCKKYAAWNWAKGMAWSIPIGCALRHIQADLYGEDNDPESGLPHIGHALCNIIMLDHFIYNFSEGNDCPPKIAFAQPTVSPAVAKPSNEWADKSDYDAALNIRTWKEDCDGI